MRETKQMGVFQQPARDPIKDWMGSSMDKEDG
jgi:hypothetical protein